MKNSSHRLIPWLLGAAALLAACGGSAAPASSPPASSAAASPPAASASAPASKPAASPPAASASAAPSKPAASPSAASASAGAAASAAPASGAPVGSAAASVVPAAPLNPPVTLEVGVLRSTVEASIYLAIVRGYFKDEGLNVNVKPFTTSLDMIPALASGQLDIGNGGPNAALFNAISQGIPVKIVADQAINRPGDQSASWMVRSAIADQIKTPKDLKGKVIGLGSTASTIDVELDKMLADGGLSRNDVQVKNVSYGDQIAAFANGSVDMTYSFEPAVTNLKAQNLATVWKTSGDVIPNHEATIVLYGANMSAAKTEAGKRFMVGYIRGIRDSWRELGNPAARNMQTVSSILEFESLKDTNLWQKVALPYTDQNAQLNRASIQGDLTYFVNTGSVKKAPQLNDVIDTSFVDYASTRVGKV